MTNWLKIARRELPPRQGDVSAVFALPASKDFKNLGDAEASDALTAANTAIQGKTEQEIFEPLPEGTAKTAKRGVSTVFTVPSPKSLEILGSEDQNATPSLSEAKTHDCSLGEEPRKLRKPPVEEEVSKNENPSAKALRKPRKPSSDEELGPSRSVITGLPLDAPRWRRALEDKTIVVQRTRKLPQLEVEREAFKHVLTEYLDSVHPNTDPARCAHCGRAETPGTTLLAIGLGDRHAWLHSLCRDPWAAARRLKAIDDLAAMGIAEPVNPANQEPRVRPIVANARRAGVTMTLDDARMGLWLSASTDPPEEIVELVKAAKPDIVAHYQAERGRINHWIANQIIAWPADFCLHCRKRILAWPWV
jgi:hypothetical protein